MVLRFRTLTFLLFLMMLSGFLSVFALNAYHSTNQILKNETLASLSQSAAAIRYELNTHLQLIDQELNSLVTSHELQQEMEQHAEVTLRQLIMGNEHSTSMHRYQFIVLSSLDNSQCYLIKSRLINIGSQICQQVYNAYSEAASQGWNAFRNGGQVLLAKDYLVTNAEQKVIGRMIGGIKLSGNSLLLNQLVNRAVVDLSSAQLMFSGVAISEYLSPKPAPIEESTTWLDDNELEKYTDNLNVYGDGLVIELSASALSINSLAKQFMKLLVSGALIGLLVSAAVAAFLSAALDKQLQKLMLYIRDLVENGKGLGWQQGAIQEFNHIGEEIDLIVNELFARRFELKGSHVKLERTLQEKRAILHQLMRSQEQERSHLAQELHDELGQLLTAVRVETVLLEHKIPLESTALEHSAKIKQLVSDMYATVYDRIMSLRPVELDDLGLNQSIQQIPTLSSLRQMGVAVALAIDEVNMPQGTDIHLYRIVQEALTNIMKHSLATEVSVSLYADEEAIVLSIIDNGQGLDASEDSAPGHKGYGLLGIKERCEYIGAKLTITSGDDGVNLRVVLPFVADE
ncbi:sensor histidine kinase [Neptunomonas qingdaonensis]|uniref:histidine kinase n=1 Tax=Neptunomonas qingdaonensis TaxID=1045558 RepID=A0A1I2NWN3_9GAMM|nr:ATP-binding protein [Neptunomonas qingdaonensis]SFG07279.1 Histidine kinase-, DNA gyrase B-, and HSP90-like ATPase [Neptunomonas qingdaonensis]